MKIQTKNDFRLCFMQSKYTFRGNILLCFIQKHVFQLKNLNYFSFQSFLFGNNVFNNAIDEKSNEF